MYKWLRPLLWTLDAERAHDLAISMMRRLSRRPKVLAKLRRIYAAPAPELAVRAFGIDFPSCIGLAAGLDKNGQAVPTLAAFGFGFIEVGTVTPRPQPGNPRPRLWRLPRHRALINQMGFNNAGAAALAENLTASAPLTTVPIGVNIGKNRDTPTDAAVHDYLQSLQTLYPVSAYIVVNVSSPNTPGLRDLQQTRLLDDLLAALIVQRDHLATIHGGPPRPILVKVAPDMATTDMDEIMDVCLSRGVAGIVATNTTVSRSGLTGAAADRPGGLSGAPLLEKSNQMIAAIYRRVGHRLPIIGVGGVMSAADAYAKFKAGATLVQVLTGFVYEGPSFVRRLTIGLQRLLARDGLPHIQAAVGVEADA